MSPKRKLQVSNGHYLMFDQLARLIYAMNSYNEHQKVTMSYLEEETGLPFRQVRNRISIGRAMGIFEERVLRQTPFGRLASSYDTFFESKGTLEYIHYLAAGNFKNLVWYEVFNTFLPNESPTDYQGWLRYFRSSLAQEYTEHTLKDHLGKEVRFIIDAYIKKGLNRLGLLHQSSDGRLYQKRHFNPEPLAFSAMLHDCAEKLNTNLLQFSDILETPGFPAFLFGMDKAILRHEVEELHERGWIRYEGTHNLDQVRLKEEYTALEFLKAYYEGCDPLPKAQD